MYVTLLNRINPYFKTIWVLIPWQLNQQKQLAIVYAINIKNKSDVDHFRKWDGYVPFEIKQ